MKCVYPGPQSMSLLRVENVSKRYRRLDRIALDDISMTLERGEMVTIWGQRRSGRSTLLRVIAGVETPDAGLVWFEGHNVHEPVRAPLGHGIAYCRTTLRGTAGHDVAELLTASRLGSGLPRSEARTRAWKALERVGAEDCAARVPSELNGEETIRVSIARALVSDPRLIVVDEPTIGVDLTARDGVLGLLRSIADEGIAVIATAGDGTGLLGADRVLVLRKGKLRGETLPDLAPVASIDRHRQARS